MSGLRAALVSQFGRPRGPLGRLAGAVMAWRPSNRTRGTATLDRLGIARGDRVLELGFGPGVTLAEAAARANPGPVTGLDHSETMVRAARRRNARALAEGRVRLVHGSAADLADLETGFDKAYAVNVYMFWRDPVAVLRGLRKVMAPGGTVALTLQPRKQGARDADAREAADAMAASLRAAGFEAVRPQILELSPVDAACVVARAPGA